ncbi:hypothetical protein L249_0574 [Ophiocordyceps polyrhachis-furcata BCC 54312]|uniref:HORMA domain-containing protein n=1 Tax=Ophiocordyceps polyrhachis-furcata BCC 54312 TaxID=1330021 RepID=A0A367LCJ5_9HYPO|nr:hypothetical protein L249_0574 [Ophiocordyceps polyrhachis-furcata BCC 54312]
MSSKAAASSSTTSSTSKEKSKVHKLSLKGSARLVAEFRGVYPAEDFTANMASTCLVRKPPFEQDIYTCKEKKKEKKRLTCFFEVSADDQVKAYIKRIMSQLDKWMVGGKISKLVIVITDKDTGEYVERWQFDVQISSQPAPNNNNNKKSSPKPASSSANQENEDNAAPNNLLNRPPPPPPPQERSEAEIQADIAALFRQITASVTFLPQLSGDCTFNVLVYADADSDVPVEWGDSDPKEIANGEHVQLRGFSTANHRVDTLVSYRLGD